MFDFWDIIIYIVYLMYKKEEQYIIGELASVEISKEE